MPRGHQRPQHGRRLRRRQSRLRRDTHTGCSPDQPDSGATPAEPATADADAEAEAAAEDEDETADKTSTADCGDAGRPMPMPPLSTPPWTVKHRPCSASRYAR